MQVQQLIDSDSGGTTAKVAKGMQQMGEHPTKTISINIFLSDGHNGLMNDCEILIDKSDSLDPTRRELFWMRVLKTIVPLGLNIDEGYNY